MSLRRLFWIGAAALLGVAALTAIAAILRGDFSQTDVNIVATSFSLLLGSFSAFLGIALFERWHQAELGHLVALAASIETILLLIAIWIGIGSVALDYWLANWAQTALVLLIAQILLTGQALIRKGNSPFLLPLTGVAVAFASAVTISAFWADNVGEIGGKSIAVFWILSVVGFLATPIANRLSQKAPLEDARRDQPSAIEIPQDSTSIAVIGSVEVFAAPSGTTQGLVIGIDDGRLAVRFGGGRRQLEAGEEIQLRPRT